MCLGSLVRNKQALRLLAIDDDPITTKALSSNNAEMLLDEEFWINIKDLHNLLLPLSKAIHAVEGNHAYVCSAVQWLKHIEEEVQNASAPLSEDDKKTFLHIIRARKQFCISSLHLAANLLDPRCQGKSLTPEESVSIIQIFKLSFLNIFN